MEETVTRIVERRFPELAGAYHLPRFAQVTAVADPPADAGLCDDYRPRYAVDLVVLLPNGEPDPDLPPLLGVPLPVIAGGTEAGFYGFPEEGTTVVVSFAYGLPNKPFILQILPHGLSLPKVPKGDQVWQHSEAAQQRVDADGNWVRQTDGRIVDHATERSVEAIRNTERYQNHRIDIIDHSDETIGGVKRIEALGALQLLSAGTANLGSVDDMNQASGRDLNLVIARTFNSVIGADSLEKIEGIRESISQTAQRIEAPKLWIGSEEINLLKIVSQLIDIVIEMNTNIAHHRHETTPPSDNAAVFASLAESAALLESKTNAITA